MVGHDSIARKCLLADWGSGEPTYLQETGARNRRAALNAATAEDITNLRWYCSVPYRFSVATSEEDRR